ncbi:MAG: DotA/TraY family protein, partial [Legionellaceae bacterium]|nr:DotA/TraY family protein [Legionellaceae bacterium]
MQAHKFKSKICALVVAGLFPVITNAQTQISILEPTSKDKSVEYLSYIFGGVVSIITGAEAPVEIDSVLGAMSAVLCAGMLLSTGGIIIYSLITGLLDTANEGNPLGKSLSTMWVPLRMVLAMALVLPLGAGYSLMQIAVLWIAGQGVGLADSVWTASIKHIQRSGTLVTPPLRGDLETIADSILLSRVCLHSTNHILRNVNVVDRPTVETIQPSASFAGPAASLVPDFARPAGYLEAQQNYDSKYGPIEATALGLASRLARNKSQGEFRSLGSNPCGQIRLKFPIVDGGSPIASEVLNFQTSIINVFGELDAELDPLARDIVNKISYPDEPDPSTNMYLALVQSFKSEYATTVKKALSAIATQRSNDWAQSGPENAMTAVGSLDAGWITAGAWYWDLVKINRETQALTAVDIAYAAPTMQSYSLKEMGQYMQGLAQYHQVKLVALENGETVEARARSSYSSESSQSGALLDGLEFLLRQASSSPDPVSMLAAGAATLSGSLVATIAGAQAAATVACGLQGSGNSIPLLGFFIDAGAGVTCYAAEWTRNFG